MNEALIERLRISCLGLDAVDPLRLLVDDVIAELESQEPVAKLKTSNVLLRCHSCGYSDKLTMQIEYTAPPQRTWVGLTDEEIAQGYETTGHYQTLRPQDKFAVYALARAIEAKLKEKNT
jgi:hypothetical protein